MTTSASTNPPSTESERQKNLKAERCQGTYLPKTILGAAYLLRCNKKRFTSNDFIFTVVQIGFKFCLYMG